MGRATPTAIVALALLAACSGAAPPAAHAAATSASGPAIASPIAVDEDAAVESIAVVVPARPRALPMSAIARTARPFSAIADSDSTYAWFRHGFDVAANGNC